MRVCVLRRRIKLAYLLLIIIKKPVIRECHAGLLEKSARNSERSITRKAIRTKTKPRNRTKKSQSEIDGFSDISSMLQVIHYDRRKLPED